MTKKKPRNVTEQLAADLWRVLMPKDTYPDKPRRIGLEELDEDDE
ncbi:hypothetical protein AB0395_29730 [Streptosporangium sp. NPDC051023]